MDAETITFKLDGDDKAYEFPEIDDLDMDEWQIVYEQSGLTLDDFMPPAKDLDGNLLDEDAETERQHRLSHPGFMRAMLQIGYQRSHPELKSAQAKAVVGKAKLMSIVEQQLSQVADILARKAEAGDSDIPPALTSEPGNGSNGNSLGSDKKTTPEAETSSSSSATSSDELDDPLAITGTGV